MNRALVADMCTEKRVMTRTRVFAGAHFDYVIQLLRSERFTGRLSIDVSQGAVGAVHVEDKSELPPLDRV